MARPKADVDEQEVEDLASIGCSYAEIATLLGVSHDTIERRFASAIKRGVLKDYVSFRRKVRAAAFPEGPRAQANVGFAVLYAKLKGWYVERSIVDQNTKVSADINPKVEKFENSVECAKQF